MTKDYSERANNFRAYAAIEVPALMQMRMGMAQKKKGAKYTLDETQHYQGMFLQAFFRLKKKALPELKREVLPLCSDIPFQQNQPYCEALVAWADGYNINTPWVLIAINNYLVNMTRGNPEKHAMVLFGQQFSVLPAATLSFEFPGWDPSTDGAGEQLTSLVNMFTDELLTKLECSADFAAREMINLLHGRLRENWQKKPA